MDVRHLVVLVLLSRVFGTDAQCPKLELDGATVNWYCNGMYKLYAENNCSRRNVYKQGHGIYYLYFRSGHWVVHNVSCIKADEGGQLKINADSTLPEDIPDTAVWQEWDNNSWQDNEDLELVCADSPNHGDHQKNNVLSAGAIAGISLGVLGIFALFLLAAAIFYKKRRLLQDQNMTTIDATPNQRMNPYDNPGMTLEGAVGVQPPAYQHTTTEEKTALP